MKSQILKFSMICLALTICLMSCDKSTDLLEDGASQLSEMPTMDESDFDPSEVEEYPSTLIATVQKDGHEIKFSTTGPPESQGILMIESLYGRAQENEEFITGLSEESTPFDIFLAMTDMDVAVPKSIAASATDNQLELSGRHIQETSRVLNVLDENYTETEEAELRACGLYGLSCYPSYSWNIGSCDSSTKTTQQTRYSYRGGWKKVRKVYARISHNCGPVSVYFYWWNRSTNSWKIVWSANVTTPRTAGVKTYSHWVPNLVERKVTFVPQYAHYRTTIQFVK